jgi:hypothetical protein
MAIVNSEEEADNLRCLYFKFGPENIQWSRWNFASPFCKNFPPDKPPTPEPANATIHIGFHDMFIEGEYLTVRSK